MVTTTLSPTAVQIDNGRPTRPLGTATPILLESGQLAGLIRVGMPSDIPSDATITSATLTLTQGSLDYSGAQTVNVYRNLGRFTVSTATWNNAPSYQTPPTASVTKTSSPAVTPWSFDVTADVAAFVSGTATNWGWRISAGTTQLRFRGSTATAGQPQLVIDYLTPADAPDGLTPDGNQAVSIALPVLQFEEPPDTVAINVRIDSDMTSPYDFESGEVPATAGQYDTAASTWPGLATGSSVYWQVQAKTSLGWTPWSDWAQFQRVDKPTVTITSPGATADDTTPPIIWTATGQVSRRVIITNAKGKTLSDTYRDATTDTIWTPPKSVSTEGATATVEVRVWDNVDRIATPGDPVYASATTTYTLEGVGSVAGADTITATSDGVTPAVTVTATRATAPDYWVLIRDGVRIKKSTTTGSPFTMTDWTADPNKRHVYRMAPGINGTGTSSGGPTAAITPRCEGIWLVDTDTPSKRAVIWSNDDVQFDATEIAIVHQPIGGPSIRRVSYRPPPTFPLTGDLVDVDGLQADDSEANLYDFKEDDRVLRLHLGHMSFDVRVGDITVTPTPDSGRSRHSRVSMTCWWQGDTPWDS
jgi:hypothetical protein